MPKLCKSRISHIPPDNKQEMLLSDCRLSLFGNEEIQVSAMEVEFEKSYKLRGQVKELMEYQLGGGGNRNMQANESLEDQDVLRLITMICGGYVEDDFTSYLSYNDFQEKKEEFDILRNIYCNVQKKYKNRKIEQSQLKFRSLLLMIYLEENINKLSRVAIERIFLNNKIVW